MFMSSAPEIGCSVEHNSKSAEIVRLSRIGLATFCGCFACIWLLLIKAHLSEIPGLGIFAFLAVKFEDHFYFWEMVIVIRKVLLMSIFLVFDQILAVLLATLLTIFSLGLQIAARPFQDRGTDLTETLALSAQLITLVRASVHHFGVYPPNTVCIFAQHYVVVLTVIICLLFRYRTTRTADGSCCSREVPQYDGSNRSPTILVALALSLLVQIDVWRAVRSDGDVDEDDDFRSGQSNDNLLR